MSYTKPSERADCKKFLENPVGALVTTSQLFSGMEAANVIWVRDLARFPLQRSNTLRAMHKLCIIDTSSNNDRTPDAGCFKVDGTFAMCHKPCVGNLFCCKSCDNSLLCHSCATVCHQSCRNGKGDGNLVEAKYRTILHTWFLQYNPCYCKNTTCCGLERSKSGLEWSAFATMIVIVIACVVATAIASAFVCGNDNSLLIVATVLAILLIYYLFVFCLFLCHKLKHPASRPTRTLLWRVLETVYYLAVASVLLVPVVSLIVVLCTSMMGFITLSPESSISTYPNLIRGHSR